MTTPGRLIMFGACCVWAVVEVIAGAQVTQPATAARCRIDGRVTSGGMPLPGVSIVVQVDDATGTTTSTDLDGRYTIAFPPGATYHLSADLTAFTRAERDVTLDAPPCATTADFVLALSPRPALTRAGPRAAGRGDAQAGRRFQTLNVEANATGTAALDTAPPEEAADVARLLPPGFSMESSQADSIAVAGNADATSLDRGVLNERLRALRLGEIDPATFAAGGFAGGQGRAGFAPQDEGGGPSGVEGGRGRGGAARGGAPGGRGGLVIGGRGARAQSTYQGSTSYTFGGSILDALPYQLRQDVPIAPPQFSTNNFGATFGGPVRIPGIYPNANRRTNFQFNYTGNQSNNPFDQYATVPTDAMRHGDFSATPMQLFDPFSGQPFSGNQIPAGRIDPGAALLLGFVPAANLPGTTQNYHVSTTSHSASDSVSLRLTQNLSPTVVPQGGRGGGASGRGGGFGLGRGGSGGRGTNIMLSAQVQYRRNQSQALNVFPNLGGESSSTSITTPITLNIAKGRSIQNVSVSFTHANTETTNAFAGAENVSAEAGIAFPGTAAADPLNWGVPNLSFSGFTAVRSAAASTRADDRLSLGYAWIHPTPKHQLRIGGDYRIDTSTAQSNANARGTFTFTGLYSSGGAQVAGRSGADFADFLLGVPQQATLQVGGTTHLRQRSIDAYVEDNWQKSAKLTFNLGLRYELARPYVELNGQMSNLDVTPDFMAAVPVISGGAGPFTGAFPAGLLNADANNFGPRLGVAYRVDRSTILRGGYSITYNSGSYANIARQLVAQPPFAETETVIGAASGPLTLAEALLSSTSATTNNFGVDRDYALGTIQTWTVSVTKNLNPVWGLTAGYTVTKGTNLDILRAPNRGPLGLLIPGVQAFIWESSGGHSMLNAGNVQLRRRLAGGVSGGLIYTVARSMDNASSLGAGGTVVAQNDRDLESEWALSSFDRRHQISGDFSIELPFGPNRHWLKNGGRLAAMVGEWTAGVNLTLQSGTPFTARVVGAATDVMRGSNGSLRADYTRAPIQLSNPTVDEFFNAAAFAVPAAGLFGDSARNTIIGPGARQLNGTLTRDVRLGGNRYVTLQLNAINLLNTVQWGSIDTSVNSPTFGQVLSVRPMRTVTVNVRFRF